MKRTLILTSIAVALGIMLTWALPVGASGLDALAPPVVVQSYDAANPNRAAGDRLLSTSLYAGDALHANLAGRVPGKAGMLAASLADMADLTKTTNFGRLVGQQIASRMAEYGYMVIESRMRAAMAVKPGQGEFLLSRDLGKLSQAEVGAQYALTGFYERTDAEVFVSVRVVRLADGRVMGGYEYSLPMTGAVRRLFETPDAQDDVWQRYAGRGNAMGAQSRQVAQTSIPYLVTPPKQTDAGPVRVTGPSRVAGPVREGDLGTDFPALAPPTRLLH